MRSWKENEILETVLASLAKPVPAEKFRLEMAKGTDAMADFYLVVDRLREEIELRLRRNYAMLPSRRFREGIETLASVLTTLSVFPVHLSGERHSAVESLKLDCVYSGAVSGTVDPDQVGQMVSLMLVWGMLAKGEYNGRESVYLSREIDSLLV